MNGTMTPGIRSATALALTVVSFASCGEAPAPPGRSRVGTPEARAALVDSLIARTARREAFSPFKEAAMDFRPLDAMERMRSQVVEADSEEELYYALARLSNARRDHHLDVSPVPGGLRIGGGPVLQAPLRVLGDFSDVRAPTFYVSAVATIGPGEGASASGRIPSPGDRVISVDGHTVPEFIDEFEEYMPYSSLHGKVWDLATIMTRRDPLRVPPWLYDAEGGIELELERPDGARYSTTLPWLEESEVSLPFSDEPLYPDFTTVLVRQNFEVLLPHDDREVVLLRWLDFEEELVQDVADLMDLALRRDLLDHTLVIDVTDSSGGSGGAYAIQRLVSRPFRTTFGNLRLSDASIAWVHDRVARGIDPSAPELFGYDLSGRWLMDWLTTDVAAAIERGDPYTNDVPFKSAHLPKDSDGTLAPAPVHFRGPVAVLSGPRGGSHLDQFISMFADNGLAPTVGMPAGGYSNTWEASQIVSLPGTEDQPLVEFMWNIGHTLRPNGEILEGNPVQPDVHIPLTRDNFRTYHQRLLEEALGLLQTRPVT